ncbi:hypothetical protein [Ureibacillus thermosphaericus]|uniref:hypothetical protein n=1 Tax=Ureibacillus thermosphaericus TaxID=51173 RepID=UPI0030C97D0D
MRSRFTRAVLFAALIIMLAFLFQQITIQFSGEGFDTPQEALPKDAEYEWIEGPKTEKEHRYFFLSNGNYFGTGVVKKNLKGWSSGNGVYAKLPKRLNENEITSAHSDGKILYGLINKEGQVEVIVNGEKATLLNLSTLPKETIDLYKVNDYFIWYVDLEKLQDSEHFHIVIKNDKDEILSELSI